MQRWIIHVLGYRFIESIVLPHISNHIVCYVLVLCCCFLVVFIKMASATGKLAKTTVSGLKQVRPILSLDSADARKRVLNLYKAWYRQIPYIGNYVFLLNTHIIELKTVELS